MSVVTSRYSCLLYLSAFATASLAALAWRRRDGHKPGIRWFGLLMGVSAVWAVAAVGSVTAESVADEWWIALGTGANALVPVAWTCFALTYAGWGSVVTRRTVAAASVVPCCTVALAATNAAHELVWVGSRTVRIGGVDSFVIDYGPWGQVHVAYSYFLFLVGLLVVFGLVRSYDNLFAGQTVALVVGAGAPLIAALTTLFGVVRATEFAVVPLAFPVTGLAFGYALFDSGFLSFVPAARRHGERAAIEHLDDGVVILDGTDQILNVNPAAARILGGTRPAMLGLPLAAVVDDLLVDDDGPVEYEPPGDYRTYEVVSSPIRGRTGRPIGRTLVFRDVTERKTQRQRLEVLNRTLRHNLRNDMNVVQGYASLLVERGAKARQVEQVMTAAVDRTAERVMLFGLLHELAEAVGEDYPHGEVLVDADDDLWLICDPRILRPVVANLIENAVQHSDEEAPTVRIGASRPDPETVEIRIADDGPGIPRAEREAVLSAGETKLRHGSGLGLWLARWGVEKLDGSLAFDADDGDGTVVTIRLPVRTDGGRGSAAGPGGFDEPGRPDGPDRSDGPGDAGDPGGPDDTDGPNRDQHAGTREGRRTTRRPR